MASGKKPKKPEGGDLAAPWSARGVSGVIPPGRKLAAAGEKRRAKWSASGVEGIAPPGNQQPGEGPVAAWVLRKEKPIETKRRKKAVETGPGRPTVGFVPDNDAAANDPKDLKTFLDEFAEFFREQSPDEENAQQLAQLIAQSHAPFEILVAFTILSAFVGTDSELRKRYQWSLERGAKVYYNLAKRLDASVRPPRGLVPRTVDPLFYDLPRAALQLPFAYSIDAFLRMLELCRGNAGYDRALMRYAREQRDRFIEGRSYGDHPLARLFPWEEPPWAPEDI